MESESTTPVKLVPTTLGRKRKTKLHWVSVDDEYPEPKTLVLISFVEHDEEGSPDEWVTLGYLTHKGMWVTTGGEALEPNEESYVTHWSSVNNPSGEPYYL